MLYAIFFLTVPVIRNLSMCLSERIAYNKILFPLKGYAESQREWLLILNSSGFPQIFLYKRSRETGKSLRVSHPTSPVTLEQGAEQNPGRSFASHHSNKESRIHSIIIKSPHQKIHPTALPVIKSSRPADLTETHEHPMRFDLNWNLMERSILKLSWVQEGNPRVEKIHYEI